MSKQITIKDVLEDIAVKRKGRTRYEGFEPYSDEILADYIGFLEAEVKRLGDTLPCTIDHVRVLPGMIIYTWDDYAVVPGVVGNGPVVTCKGKTVLVGECYSTSKAALDAAISKDESEKWK